MGSWFVRHFCYYIRERADISTADSRSSHWRKRMDECANTCPITCKRSSNLCVTWRFAPMSVETSSSFSRSHLITLLNVRVDTVERPNSCQWLGWLYTITAALAFLKQEWNAAPKVRESLRAFRALYCAARLRLPLLIRDAQNAETSFWVARMFRASAQPLIREGGLELPVTHLPVQRPRGCIDFE